MSKKTGGRPFILRSEAFDKTAKDDARFDQIVAELSKEDIERVAGAGMTVDLLPDYAPKGATDTYHDSHWDPPNAN